MHLRLSSLLFACVIGNSLVHPGLNAQVRDTTDRIFFENYVFATEGGLESGADFTSSVYSLGNISRMLYRIPVSRRLSVHLGAGLGVRGFSQKSALDRQECRRISPTEDCSFLDGRYVRANHLSVFLELPAQVRYLLGGKGQGPYLTAGTAAQLPIINSVETYAVNTNGNETLLQDDELTARVSQLLSAGLGWQIRESYRNFWYLELTYSWSTNPVIENTVGTRRQNLALNYFQTIRARQLGLTGGFNF